MTLHKYPKGVPYWRLSGFYFVYFAALGAILPYWSLYLQSIDFDARAIGQLTAILVASKIIAPNIWGWLADHHGRRMSIIRLGSIISMIAFAGVFFTDSFWGLALVMLCFGFFWNATLPQFEVITLNHLGDSHHGYSRIRVWGSIGFVLTVWLLGVLFEHKEIVYLLPVIFIIMILISANSFMLSDSSHVTKDETRQSIIQTLKKPQVIALIITCFLMQASHAPYYTFYSIYLEGHHYSLSFIGKMWALGVIAEVFVFLYMHRLSQKFSIKHLLMLSLFLAGMRWILIAFFIEHMAILIFAQLLHAASFGLYHACAISLFHEHFTGSIQGRGQAIYSSMSFGAGLTLGSFISGYSWEGVGQTITFIGAASLCFIALLISWRWVAPLSQDEKCH